jgi:predicted dehydrogenase
MIRFSVIGVNHGHIYGQVNCLLNAGATFVSWFAPEPELVAEFAPRYPQAKLARSEEEILNDPSIQLIVSAGIPCDRAPLGIRVMRAGKDYMTDKPGMTTLAQLDEVRRVQRETGRIYSICYSERFETRCTVHAGELVKQGAIGKVIQTVGLGPHLRRFHTRAPWFFEKAKYGGILCDIASHQFDQFLYFTNSTQAEIVASQIGNVHHPQYPELEDFGDVMLHGNGGVGYVRVDWFTPDGLPTWGDGRLTILGTDGYIELRKYIDIMGKPGGEHLFLVNKSGMQYIDCKDKPLPYGSQLIHDVLNRTETAMTQEHCFLAMELALKAEAAAKRIS